MELPTCLFCGRCLNVCPIFQYTLKEEWSPRSKAFTLNILSKIEPPLGPEEISHVIGICLGCGRCEKECPQHISLPRLVMEVKEKSPSFKRWMFGRFLAAMPWVFGKFGFLKTLASPLGNKKIKALLEYSRYDPPDMFKLSYNKGEIRQKDKGIIFPGCGGEFLRPLWKGRMRDIASFSYEIIDESGFVCCGYPLLFAGLKQKALEYMRHNIAIWQGHGYPYIIVGCATCEKALRDYYPSLLEGEERKKWKDSIVSLNEIISECSIVPYGDTTSFVLHSPCHLSLSLFHNVVLSFQRAGATFQVEDFCCGFGGSMRLENPMLCDMLGNSIWDRMGRGNMVVSMCTGCIIQFKLINPSSPVFHWIDLIKI